jgi:hypothetical protein
VNFEAAEIMNDTQAMPSAPSQGPSILNNRAMEATLRQYIGQRNYVLLVRSLQSGLGTQLRSDQTGDLLEKCIDWCAQYGGRYEDVKAAVRAIFQAIYLDLPQNVQIDFGYLADEVGFDIEKAKAERKQRPLNRWVSRLLVHRMTHAGQRR